MYVELDVDSLHARAERRVYIHICLPLGACTAEEMATQSSGYFLWFCTLHLQKPKQLWVSDLTGLYIKT